MSTAVLGVKTCPCNVPRFVADSNLSFMAQFLKPYIYLSLAVDWMDLCCIVCYIRQFKQLVTFSFKDFL